MATAINFEKLLKQKILLYFFCLLVLFIQTTKKTTTTPQLTPSFHLKKIDLFELQTRIETS